MRLGWPIWLLARDSMPPLLFPAEIAVDGGADIDKRVAIEMEEGFKFTDDVIGEFWFDDQGIPRVAYRVCGDCIPVPLMPLGTWFEAIRGHFEKAGTKQ